MIIIIGMSGCTRGEKLEIKEPDGIPSLVSSVFMDEVEAESLQNVVPIRLYYVILDEPDKLKMEVQYIAFHEVLRLEGLVGVIIKKLLKGPEDDSSFQKIIGEGVELKGEPEFNDGVITLDFNEHFYKELEKDPRVEDLVIYSIVNSLTELKEVERVNFLKDGKNVENYLGKRNMNTLFYRNPDMISQEV